MDSLRDFTVGEDFDRPGLFAEAMEIVRYTDIHLGTSRSTNQDGDRKAKALDLLDKLDKEQATFSPRLDVRPWTAEDFSERGVTPSRELAARLRDHRFYHVRIPVTLFPRSGWAFTRLECWVTFCPDEEDPRHHATVYDIFPDDIWSELFRFEDQLQVGLDEDLSFRAAVEDLEGSWRGVGGEAKARLAATAEARAKLVAGPFSYRLRRPEIRARGRLNVESFWRLDGKRHVDEEEVVLSVVLMVPKARRQPLTAAAELRAYHDFQLWTSDLFKDWSFGAAIRSLLGSGAVITSRQEWRPFYRLPPSVPPRGR